MDFYEKDARRDICAVIVSYNPEPLLLENIEALLPQIHRCLVVDNGSTEQTVLQEAKRKYGIDVIELGENKGIAFALNVGLEYCAQKGYPLVLTMDQDTVLFTNAVECLLKAMLKEGAVSAGINWDRSISETKCVEYLITSGNLVTVEAAKSIGGFDEALFIDSVDFDFCLRLQDKGFTIVKVADAGAKHNLGEKTGSRWFRTHSAFRYYYISRNHFYILHKFEKSHRWFCIKKRIAFAREIVLLTLFDRERTSKYKALLQGYRDFKATYPERRGVKGI